MTNRGLKTASVETDPLGYTQKQHHSGRMHRPQAIFRVRPVDFAERAEDARSDFPIEALEIGDAEPIVTRAVIPPNQIRVSAMRGIDRSELSQRSSGVSRKPDTGGSIPKGTDPLPIGPVHRQRVSQGGCRFNDGDQYVSMPAIQS